MACVNYTPFAHLSDEELISEVCCKKDVTDLELELMQRLEHHMEKEPEVVVETRYVEHDHA